MLKGVKSTVAVSPSRAAVDLISLNSPVGALAASAISERDGLCIPFSFPAIAQLLQLGTVGMRGKHVATNVDKTHRLLACLCELAGRRCRVISVWSYMVHFADFGCAERDSVTRSA